MSEIDAFASLLNTTQKNIITVINAKTDALAFHQSQIELKIDSQAQTVTDLEGKVEEHDDILRERALTCLPAIQKLTAHERAIKLINFIGDNKFLSVSIMVLTLFVVQSLVYLVFQNIELANILERIYK